MSEAKRIKEYYIQPPIILIDTDWQKRKHGSQFKITTKIWVDQHVHEYRVAIPEAFGLATQSPTDLIETRFITYVPTGRVVYDTTRRHCEAIVYEYILESLLGKTDLRHKASK